MESIIDRNQWGRTDVFNVVNEFPKGYQVWNIGRQNFNHECFLPLCVADSDCHADLDSLKATRVESEELALYILKQAGRKTITARNIQRVINEYKSK